MNKEAFLAVLRNELSGLPREDIEERLAFYSEMIDDRMEEGLNEEDAVAEMGAVEDIAAQTLEEIPLAKIVRESVAPKRALRAWEIILIVLGFPIWFPLLIAAAAVVFALYLVIWVLVVCLWAVDAALGFNGLGCIATGVASITRGDVLPGIALMGAGLVCAGLAIFLVFGCLAASKGAVRLGKAVARGIKRLFVRKESAK